MNGEPIQDLFVRFGADVSEYQQGVTQVVDQSNQAYLAMTKSTNATEDWVDAVNKAAHANLAEPMQQGAAAADDMTSKIDRLNEMANEFLEEYPARTQQFIDAQGRARDELGKFLPMVPATADGIKEIGNAAQQAAGGVNKLTDNTSSMLKQLLQLAGVAISLQALKRAVEEAFTAFAQVERAQESLAALTGSASNAVNMIERLRSVAQSDALSFPSLLAAQQKMTALGFSAQQSAQMIEAAANASRAMNTDFGTAAGALDRILETGNAGTRQLLALGLSATNLGDAMGVTADSAKKLFSSLDQESQVSVMIAALQKFKDLASNTANDLTGQWQQFQNTIRFTFEEIGKAIAPAGVQFLQFAADDVKAIGSIIQNVIAMGTTISQQSVIAISAMSAMAVAAKASALAVGLALIQWGLAMQQTADAEAEAERAGKQFSDGLSKVSITAHQTFAQFPDFLARLSSLDSDLNHGVKSWQEYIKGVQGLNAEFYKLHPNLVQASQTHETYAQSVAKLTAQLNSGAITQAVYDAELNKLIKSHMNAGAAAAAQAAEEAAAAKAWKEFVDEETKMAVPFGSPKSSRFSPETIALAQDYNAAMKEGKAIADNAALAHANLNNAIDTQPSLLHKALAGWKEFMAGGWDLMTEKLDASMLKIGQAVQLPSTTFKWDPITHGFDEIQNKAKGVTTETQKMIAGFMLANEQGLPPLDSLQEALKGLGIKIDDVTGQATTKALELWQTVAGKGNLSEVDAAWAKVSGMVTKLAKTDLPAAINAENEYIEALIRVGAPLGQIYDAQAKELQLEIQMAEQRGTDATAQMIQLQNINDRLQVLHDHSTALGDVYQQLDKTFQGVFDKMGKAIADNIVDAKSWGDAFQSVLKTIEKEILETLVGYVFKQLKNALLENTNLIGGLAGGITKVLGLGSGGGGGLFGAGNVGGGIFSMFGGGGGQVFDNLGTDITPLMSSGGGAGGAAGAGGIFSSFSGIVGLAGLGVSIASGIVQGIQGAHMNNLLGEIEVSTRYLKVGLVDGNSLMVLYIGQMKDRLTQIVSGPGMGVFNAAGDSGLRLAPESIAQLRGGSLAIATGSIGVFNAPGDNGLKLSPDSINALADAIVSRGGGGASSAGSSAAAAVLPPRPAVIDKLSDATFRRFKQRGLDPTRA